MRSYEIGACGACGLYQDTSEHRKLLAGYPEEGFFRTPDELKSRVSYLLENQELRQSLRSIASRSVCKKEHTYKSVRTYSEKAVKLKVTIVVGGRWHAFDLAGELERKGHLHKLITNYPSWFVRRWGISETKIVSLPLTLFLVKLIYKIGGEALMMKMQWIIHQRFANQAAKFLEGTEILHAWSGFAEPSLKWAKSRKIKTVLERSSAHILEQSSLLRDEYLRLQSSWNHTHPKIEEMECREYCLASIISVPSLFVKEHLQNGGMLSLKSKNICSGPI